MTPHDTGSTGTPGAPRATAPPPRTFGPQGPTLGELSDAYLQDYQVRQFRSQSTARGRIAHLTAFFGRAARAAALTTYQIRQYQLARRAAGAATGTINRETSALHRMGTLAVHWGWLDTVPGFPDRLRENPPRQGFFEHPEYLAVRAHLPAPWQDILDLAYYSGWRKNEILGLTWEEIDMAGGIIRLSPARSKTLVGRILPISQPIAEALARRRARRDPDSPLVFHRDGIPVRRWRTAWRTAARTLPAPDVRRHATLPQSWIQRENWEFETHRVHRAALSHQERRASIPLQVLRMLGESTDEKDWVSVLEGNGHERAVGVAGRLQCKGTQRPGRDPRDQRARALRVRGCRNMYVVQRLRRVAGRPSVCVSTHGAPCPEVRAVSSPTPPTSTTSSQSIRA